MDRTRSPVPGHVAAPKEPVALSRGHPVLALQQTIGNRAVARLVSPTVGSRGPVRRKPARPGRRPVTRKRRGLGRGWADLAQGRIIITDVEAAVHAPIPDYPAGGNVRAALAKERPGLLEALTADELEGWQRSVDRSAAERYRAKMDRALVVGGAPYSFKDAYDAWVRRSKASLPPEGLPGGQLKVPVARFLDKDVLNVDRDVMAETAFRRWAIGQLSAKPIDITLIDPDLVDTRFASQLLPTNGRIDGGALFSMFPTEHKTMVSERPALAELRKMVSDLEAVHAELDPQFRERLRLNKKYSGGWAFVRYWSEWLGEGDAEMPEESDWNRPYYLTLGFAKQALRENRIELAVPLLAQAEIEMAAVAQQFIAYENRVTSGAATVVTWLNRFKIAGSVAASLAAGPLGWARAAAVAGAYAGGQELAGQTGEMLIGTRGSFDAASVAKTTMIATVSGMISAPLQQSMRLALVKRFSGAGPVNIVEDAVASSVASMTQTFYTAPIEAVMSRLAVGKPMPSVQELADMVVDQALTAGASDPVLNALGGAIARERAKAAADAQANDPGALGSAILSEGAAGRLAPGGRATTGASTGTAKSGSVDHSADHAADGASGGGRRADPAKTPDPRYESGLLSQDVKSRIAYGAYDAFHNTPRATETGFRSQRDFRKAVENIAAVVRPEVTRLGIPMPKIKVVADARPGYKGSYDSTNHVITVNRNAEMYQTGDVFQTLLGVIVHESRHVEQAFHALRVRAGRQEGQEPLRVSADIVYETKAAKVLVDAAVAAPIKASDTSAEARLGREIWSEKFQAGPRKDLRDWAQTANQRRPDQKAKLEEIRLKLAARDVTNSEPGTRAILDKVNQVQGDLSKAYEHYFNLAGEIDARRAQHHVEGLFNAKLALQAEINQLRARVDGLRVQAASLEEAIQRNARFPNVARAARAELERIEEIMSFDQLRLVDRLQNEMDLLPLPAMSTQE